MHSRVITRECIPLATASLSLEVLSVELTIDPEMGMAVVSAIHRLRSLLLGQVACAHLAAFTSFLAVCTCLVFITNTKRASLNLGIPHNLMRPGRVVTLYPTFEYTIGLQALQKLQDPAAY
jgi:hypothetical protein